MPPYTKKGKCYNELKCWIKIKKHTSVAQTLLKLCLVNIHKKPRKITYIEF